jgi:hypothetical protein
MIALFDERSLFYSFAPEGIQLPESEFGPVAPIQ